VSRGRLEGLKEGEVLGWIFGVLGAVIAAVPVGGMVLGAVIQAVAAGAVWKSAKEAEHASRFMHKDVQAQQVSEMLAAYASEEMLIALEPIRNWRRDHCGDWGGSFPRI
jgi:hypothetical protein